jgi:hypothetical protein
MENDISMGSNDNLIFPIKKQDRNEYDNEYDDDRDKYNGDEYDDKYNGDEYNGGKYNNDVVMPIKKQYKFYDSSDDLSDDSSESDSIIFDPNARKTLTRAYDNIPFVEEDKNSMDPINNHISQSESVKYINWLMELSNEERINILSYLDERAINNLCNVDSQFRNWCNLFDFVEGVWNYIDKIRQLSDYIEFPENVQESYWILASLAANELFYRPQYEFELKLSSPSNETYILYKYVIYYEIGQEEAISGVFISFGSNDLPQIFHNYFKNKIIFDVGESQKNEYQIQIEPFFVDNVVTLSEFTYFLYGLLVYHKYKYFKYYIGQKKTQMRLGN